VFDLIVWLGFDQKNWNWKMKLGKNR